MAIFHQQKLRFFYQQKWRFFTMKNGDLVIFHQQKLSFFFFFLTMKHVGIIFTKTLLWAFESFKQQSTIEILRDLDASPLVTGWDDLSHGGSSSWLMIAIEMLQAHESSNIWGSFPALAAPIQSLIGLANWPTHIICFVLLVRSNIS